MAASLPAVARASPHRAEVYEVARRRPWLGRLAPFSLDPYKFKKGCLVGFLYHFLYLLIVPFYIFAGYIIVIANDMAGIKLI